MRALLCSLLTVILLGLPGIAFARDRLWPTSVDTGDCSASLIYTQRSKFQEKLDNEYCIDGNTDNPDKIITCIKNSRSYRFSPFFTDMCHSDDMPFYISLNGVTYELRLVEKNRSSPVYFSGRYLGEGIEVTIKSGSLLRKVYDRPYPHAKREVVSVEYNVLVIVKKGEVVERIPGVFWQGLSDRGHR